jgi:hypothetical protein
MGGSKGWVWDISCVDYSLYRLFLIFVVSVLAYKPFSGGLFLISVVSVLAYRLKASYEICYEVYVLADGD